MKARDVASLLILFRSKLNARGIRGMFTIGRMFRLHDDRGSGTVDKTKWLKILKDYRIDLSS